MKLCDAYYTHIVDESTLAVNYSIRSSNAKAGAAPSPGGRPGMRHVSASPHHAIVSSTADDLDDLASVPA